MADDRNLHGIVRVWDNSAAVGMADSGWFVSTSAPPTGVRFNRLVASGSGIDGGTIVPDQWHHVVAVFDGTTALLYLDGVKVNDVTQNGDLPAVTPLVRIGDGDTWGNFQGTIDEVAIYDQALSASPCSNSQGFVTLAASTQGQPSHPGRRVIS